MKTMRRAVTALLFPLSLFGCGNKGGTEEPVMAATAKGIDASGNDPAVVALANRFGPSGATMASSRTAPIAKPGATRS